MSSIMSSEDQKKTFTIHHSQMRDFDKVADVPASLFITGAEKNDHVANLEYQPLQMFNIVAKKYLPFLVYLKTLADTYTAMVDRGNKFGAILMNPRFMGKIKEALYKKPDEVVKLVNDLQHPTSNFYRAMQLWGQPSCPFREGARQLVGIMWDIATEDPELAKLQAKASDMLMTDPEAGECLQGLVDRKRRAREERAEEQSNPFHKFFMPNQQLLLQNGSATDGSQELQVELSKVVGKCEELKKQKAELEQQLIDMKDAGAEVVTNEVNNVKGELAAALEAKAAAEEAKAAAEEELAGTKAEKAAVEAKLAAVDKQLAIAQDERKDRKSKALGKAEERAKEAEKRAKDAEERAKEAEKRAKDAEKRAEAAEKELETYHAFENSEYVGEEDAQSAKRKRTE
ncbi:hypothetical protein HK104_007266 [Borealophlyctis nickersoniae]|nr:hypothetical protein HK104_007266 [Borealophlyctis nickersoniae]